LKQHLSVKIREINRARAAPTRFLAAARQEIPFEELRAAFERLMSKAGDGVIDKDYCCLVAGFEVEINARKAAGSMMQVLHSAKTRWA